MAIRNGDDVNATYITDNFGKIAKVVAQAIYNNDYNGLHSNLSGHEDYGEVFFDTFKDTSKISEGGDGDSGTVAVGSKLIGGFNVLDDHEDSSVDTNIWSTNVDSYGSSSVTENSGRLRVESQASSTSTLNYHAEAWADQVNAPDLNNNTVLLLRTYRWANINHDFYVRMKDESGNQVNLHTGSGTPDTLLYFKIIVDPSSNTAKVYVSTTDDAFLSTSPSSVDISALSDTDKWSIGFRVNTTTNNDLALGYQDIYYEIYSQDSTSSSFISTQTTTTSNVQSVYITSNSDTTYGNVSWYVSTDGGSTWESVTEEELKWLSSVGTQLKVKGELSITTQSVSSDNPFPIIYEYATFYNIGV